MLAEEGIAHSWSDLSGVGCVGKHAQALINSRPVFPPPPRAAPSLQGSRQSQAVCSDIGPSPFKPRWKEQAVISHRWKDGQNKGH